MSRGRRLETGGFGIYLGAILYVLSPWAAVLVSLAFIVLGFGLQLRASRKFKAAEPITNFSHGLSGERLKLFTGELEELVKHYGGEAERPE